MNQHFEKTLTSEKVFDGKVIRVYYDTVELENGDTSFREVEGFLRTREPQEYVASNARLIARLELVASMEQFSLQNLL